MNNNFEHPTIPQNDTWESPPHHSINQSAAATSLTDHDALTFNLFIYVLPLMIVVGSVANFLVFLVMRRPKMRHQTTGFYMAILAIADELALLCGCLNKWLWEFNKVTILHMSPAACKIFSSIFYTTMDFSVWMVVIMTVERFIAVTFPLKAAYFCTIKKAKYATLATLVVTFAVNAHFLVTHTFIYRNNEHGCQSKSETFDEFMHFMWPWIDASKYSFIPVITIFIFNILIIYNLVQASDSRSKLISGDSSANKLRQANASAPQYTSASTAASSTPQSSNNNRRLTTMLLVVSITFCILSTPLLVLQILEQAKIVQRTVVLLRINAVCLFLQYSNHTVNFFLYAVTGKIFRRELVGLFLLVQECCGQTDAVEERCCW